jgi:hypothetical protein
VKYALTRRRLLVVGLGMSGAALLAACSSAPSPTPGATAKPAEPKPAESKPAAPAAQPAATSASAAAPAKPAESKPAEKAAPAAGASQESGTFNFAAYDEQESRQVATNEWFAKNYPNMKVQYDITPGLDPYFVKMQTQIAGNAPPDYMLMHETRALSSASTRARTTSGPRATASG